MAVMAHVVAHGAVHAFDQGASRLSKLGWIGQGFKGLSNVGQFGVGAVFSYYTYAHDYGMGTAGLASIASYYPVTGVALFLIGQGRELGNHIYRSQQAKRTSSFAKSSIDDRFGTINKMRQYSIQQLSRDHTSKQRTMGQEAFYLHR